jgi:PAS domain S-box-containing protein
LKHGGNRKLRNDSPIAARLGAADFLAGGGETGALLRAMDWAASPLGPTHKWPPAFKAAVSICLASPAPIIVWWGRNQRDVAPLYNDACRQLMGTLHPHALGVAGATTSPEVWGVMGPILEAALRGEAVRRENQYLPINRNGRLEPAWFTHSHSPILDAQGRAIGIFTVLNETTAQVRAVRRLAFEAQLDDSLRDIDDPAAVLRTATRLLGQHLQADRCGFGEVTPAGDSVLIEADWTANGASSLAGDYRMEGFQADLLAQCRAGRLVRLNTPKRGERGEAALVEASAQPAAGLAMPLLHDGEFVAALYVHAREPRVWSEDEVETLDLAAERTWTELKRARAEHQLRESEARMALAARASGLGIWDARADRDEVILSPRAREIWDFPPDVRITRQDFLDRVLPEDRTLFAQPSPFTEDGARERPYEMRLRGADGEIRWVRAYAQPIVETVDGREVVVRAVGTMEDVTDERRMQATLQESEARWRLALDAGRMAVWRMDARGRVEATPALNRLLGLPDDRPATLEELAAHDHPEDRHRLYKTAKGALARGERYFDVEYRRLLPEGETQWLMVRAELLREQAGVFTGAIGVVVDITQRKRTEAHGRQVEKELRDSESRLRIAQVAGRIGTFELIPKQRLMLVSEAFCHLWGVPVQPEYPVDELVGMVHPDDVGLLRGQRLDPDNQDLDYREYRIRRRDTGELRWMARRGEARRDESGRTRYLGVSYDITDRKLAELALQELNENLEAEVAERTAERDRMWRLSAELMVVTDFKGAFVAANPAWRKVLGWTEADLKRRTVQELVHPEDVERTAREMARLVQGVTTFNFESRFRHKDGGYRLLSWTAVPDAGFIHGLGRDVTEERAAAEALKRTEEALRQSQKMEAVGQLTGGIAHDFNNMLAIVIGGLDLAQRRLERGQDARRYLDNAREGALRAASLTQRLLAFSRRQPLTPKVLNLNRLVGDMSELLRRTLGETVALETVVAGRLWSVNADPGQMENALINLAVNGRDAMPAGGQLTVETANAHLDEAYAAEHPGLTAGQYVMIAVSDRGSGMSSDVQERAFDPFFTTKPAGQGTGLGLSMVYGFVKQSGGHIAIYSEVGVGTTVKIYLPRHFGEVPPEEAGPAQPAADSFGGEVVLVVEDEDRVRQMSVDALRELGYQVHEAAGGEDALRRLGQLERVDLLFTDVVMPGMGGRELAQEVGRRAPHVKVLYTTGYTPNAVVHNGVLDGGVAFLPKPFSVADLAAKVRAILDR